MGTRGALGYHLPSQSLQGESKIQYDHFDSYPEGLGVEFATSLLDIVNREQLSVLEQRVQSIELVGKYR